MLTWLGGGLMAFVDIITGETHTIVEWGYDDDTSEGVTFIKNDMLDMVANALYQHIKTREGGVTGDSPP